MEHVTRCTLAALATTFATWSQAANVTFVDSTVNPASYVTLIYRSDPSVNIAVSGTALGNPGAGLQLEFTNAGGAINMFSTEGFINNAFAYNPSTQGAITSVRFSNDRYVDAGNAAVNASLSVSSRVLLLQNGLYYFASFLDPQVRGSYYSSASGNFSAADFGLFDFATGAADPSLTPDFSSTGSLIDFGFANRFNLGTAGAPFALDAVFRFDNISIVVNAVPEPSVLVLGCFAFAAAGAAVRRRSPASSGDPVAA